MLKKKTIFAVIIIAVTAAVLCATVFKKPLLKLIFPVKHEQQISGACEKFGLEPSLIYGIIWVESGFDENAQSHAQAIGLMQMMPDTFTWLRDNDEALPYADISGLYDPDINIEYGCCYIDMLMERFENEASAIAAYNAGPGNVEAWLGNSDYSKDGITLSEIPIKETKDYVKKVNDAKNMYEYLYFDDN